MSEGRPRAGYTVVTTCRRCEGRRGFEGRPGGGGCGLRGGWGV